MPSHFMACPHGTTRFMAETLENMAKTGVNPRIALVTGIETHSSAQSDRCREIYVWGYYQRDESESVMRKTGPLKSACLFFIQPEQNHSYPYGVNWTRARWSAYRNSHDLIFADQTDE